MITARAPTVRPSRKRMPFTDGSPRRRGGAKEEKSRGELRSSLCVPESFPISLAPEWSSSTSPRPRGESCPSTINSATSACLINRLGWLSRTSRIFRRYCCLSHCARGDHTAGPREVLSSRNCMPTASVTSPIIPPRASTSRTRCPLAIPPTAGLHDIWAIRSTLRVRSAVLRPIRAAAIAASQPAWPAPTTTTSYCSV